MIRARTWLFSIAGLSAASGLVAGLLSDESGESALGASFLLLLPIYVLTYLWMKADALERSRDCPPGATPLIVGLYPIAVPYHLLATRSGWRRALALFWFLGFVVLVLVLNSLSAYAGYLLVT